MQSSGNSPPSTFGWGLSISFKYQKITHNGVFAPNYMYRWPNYVGSSWSVTTPTVGKTLPETVRQSPPLSIWKFPEMGVPKNHPCLVGLSIINHPFGVPTFSETSIFLKVDVTLPTQVFTATSSSLCQLPKPSLDHFPGAQVHSQQSTSL